MSHSSGTERLPRAFFRRDSVTVARALLGQQLVHHVNGEPIGGTIVETEAYLGVRDKAAHSFGGRRTKRTETMYGDGGTAYVYLNYGIHHLFNIVVTTIDDPQAVLIRALEPTIGLQAMYLRRPKAMRATDLCSGPGKLSAALGIDIAHNKIDLTRHPNLFVRRQRQRTLPGRQITATARVGIDYAEEWVDAPLRFYVTGNSHISVK